MLSTWPLLLQIIVALSVEILKYTCTHQMISDHTGLPFVQINLHIICLPFVQIEQRHTSHYLLTLWPDRANAYLTLFVYPLYKYSKGIPHIICLPFEQMQQKHIPHIIYLPFVQIQQRHTSHYLFTICTDMAKAYLKLFAYPLYRYSKVYLHQLF